jgi:hypothetical protein
MRRIQIALASLLVVALSACSSGGGGSGGSGGGSGGNGANTSTTGAGQGGGAVSAGGGGSTGGAGAAGGGAGGGGQAGAIHWTDPLDYQKPAPLAVAMPDEASVANKYYLDFSNGGGTACSEAAPCNALRSLIGKPGIAGGPAYVYVRGSGQFFIYQDVFHGSDGQEIVIKPWGGATAEFHASDGTLALDGPDVHHVIIDGGPDLRIHFVSDAQDAYGLHVKADDVTVYRTQAYATVAAMLFAACDDENCARVSFINNEMHDCNMTDGYQCSGIYWGPGNGGGYTTARILNNVIRSVGGEGLEINPRVTSDDLEISGNAIHDVGKATCSGSWQCRPGITVGVQSGNGNNGTMIRNNLIWDTGSGCVWDRGGGQPAPRIFNNTCYDYAKGANQNTPNPEGISGYSNSGTAEVRNNVIFAPNGTAPFDGSNFTASNNMCSGGCGTSSQAWSSSALVLTMSPTFLRPTASSQAKDHGMTVDDPVDYAGVARPQGAAFDIGAFEEVP